jgi:predicted MFS family arabinose efflux permease
MSSLAVPKTNTMESSGTAGPSPSATIVGDASTDYTKPDLEPVTVAPKAVMSQRKKWSLLGVFSLAFFIDIWSYSAFFIFTGPISEDLSVVFAQQSWVITSYAVTFSAFLLFWGRMSDLFSPKHVFAYGFIALGVLNLVISFLPDKYSFFVIRAISGIAGAAL